MHVGRRVLAAFVVLAPLVALTVLGVLIARRYYRAQTQDLAPAFAAEATSALGHEVTIGHLSLRGPEAILDDVRVAEGRTLAQGGAIASARRVVLDFGTYRALLQGSPDLPRFGRAVVYSPVVRVVRSSTGVWNFADILRPRAGPPSRPLVGAVQVLDGILYFDDRALAHNPGRPATPVRGRFSGVRGTLTFRADKTTTWAVAGTETTGQASTTQVSGSYNSGGKDLLVQVAATGVALPLLNRVLPPEETILAGRGSGTATLMRRPGAPGAPLLDYQANVSIAGGVLSTARLAEPIRDLRGAVTLTDQVVTGRLDGALAGSVVHAEGMLLGGAAAPVLDGWVSGQGVSLSRVLTALRLERRYPLLRQLEASADVRAALHGPPSALTVSAAGPARVRGTLAGGPSVPQPALLQVAISGPLSSPTITATGTLPAAQFRGYRGRNLWLSGVWSTAKAAADFTGEVAGGRVTGRVYVSNPGTRAGYNVSARARHLDVNALVAQARSSGSGRRAGDSLPPVGGAADADVTVQGELGRGTPRARALVRASGVRYDRWRADQAQAYFYTAGDLLRVDDLEASGPVGSASAAGTVDLKSHRLDMQVGADSLNVARLLEGYSGAVAGGLQGPGQPVAPPAASGYAFVRGGRITGTWDQPSFDGHVRAYDLALGRVSFDFAEAQIAATKSSVTLSSSAAYRFPAVARIAGTIRDPLAAHPTASLNGSFEDVEAQDLVALAGSDAPVLGTARGAFSVEGALPLPRVAVDPIVVDHASVAEVDFDRASGRIRFEPGDKGGTWYAEANGASDGAAVAGSGSLDDSGVFHVSARADGVSITRFMPPLAPYVIVQGMVSGGGTLTGRLREGAARHVDGSLEAHSTDLLVNTVALGEVTATVPVADGRIGPVSAAVGPPGRPLARVTEVEYDRTRKTLRVVGSVNELPLETLRQLAAGSPWVSEQISATPAAPAAPAPSAAPAPPAAPAGGKATEPLASQVARWLVTPTESPPRGSIDAGFVVEGPTEGPITTVSWENHGEWTINGQTVQNFAGKATVAAGLVTIQTARLRSGEMDVTARGTYSPGDSRVAADLTSAGFSLERLQRWVPSSPQLKDWSGTARTIGAHVEGTPGDLSVELSAENADVSHTVHSPVGDRHVRVAAERASVGNYSPATQRGGIRLAGALVTVEDAPGTEARPQIAASSVQITSAVLEFYWQLPEGPADRTPVLWTDRIVVPGSKTPLTPYVPADPFVSLDAVVQGQGLAALALALPNVQEAAGTVSASLKVSGHLREPRIDGSFAVSQTGGQRILNGSPTRTATARTAVTGLDVSLLFMGDYVQVERFKGQTQLVGTGSAGLERPGEPITMEGRLALTGARQAGDRLHLVAKQFGLAISPLPEFQSGRFVSDRLSADITVAGTLTSPMLIGVVDVRDADLRVPSAPAEALPRIALPIKPRYDLAFNVGSGVRVASAQMVASVRTEPNAPILIHQRQGTPPETEQSDETQIDGTLVVDSGTLLFPTARFEIQPGGEATLRYPYFAGFENGEPQYVFGVSVNITAATHLSAPSITGEVRRYTVYVQATGPINVSGVVSEPGTGSFGTTAGRGLQLTFRSDPPDLAYTQAGLQQRVMGLLGGQQAISGLFSSRPDVGRIFGEQVTDILSANLLPDLFERLGIARALGFEEFTIEYNRLDPFVLRLSRRLVGPFYISFWQRLSGISMQAGDRTAWELKLSYHIRHNLQFSWTTDDQRTNGYLLEGVYRF